MMLIFLESKSAMYVIKYSENFSLIKSNALLHEDDLFVFDLSTYPRLYLKPSDDSGEGSICFHFDSDMPTTSGFIHKYYGPLIKNLRRFPLLITEKTIENGYLKQQLNALYHSKSWYITKPLRFFTGLMRQWFSTWGRKNCEAQERLNIQALQDLSRHRIAFVERFQIQNQCLQVEVDVSVVTFNSEKWIDAFFASLLNSSYSHKLIHLIIVDNASTDNTIAKIEEMQRKYKTSFASFSLIFNKKNTGFGGGHHLAILNSHSDYILVTNIDLEFQNDAIEAVMNTALNEQSQAVASWELRQLPYEHPKYYDPVTHLTNWSSHACILMKREAYQAVGGYEPKIFMYAEDVELSYRLRANGYLLKYCPKASVLHHSYEDIYGTKPLQYKYSVLGNAYVRVRFGTKGVKLQILMLYLKLVLSPSVFPGSKREIIKNFGKVVWNYFYFDKKTLRIDNFAAPFRGFDYELSRLGSDYPLSSNETSGSLISIIIRTYQGRARFLKEALISVENQIYSNIEIIVVEDGGSSATEIIEHFSLVFNKKIHYYSCAKVGRCVVGNVGLSHASGKYCMFLDDDDLLFADHVGVLVEALEKQAYYCAAYSSAFEAKTEILDDKNYLEASFNLIKQHDREVGFKELLEMNYLPIQCILFKRTLFEERGGFDESLEYLEDWNLWIRYAYANEFKYIRKTTSLYRVPTDNTHRGLLHEQFIHIARDSAMRSIKGI